MWVPEESDTRSGGTNKQRGEQVCRAPRSRRKVSRGQNRWKARGAQPRQGGRPGAGLKQAWQNQMCLSEVAVQDPHVTSSCLRPQLPRSHCHIRSDTGNCPSGVP